MAKMPIKTSKGRKATTRKVTVRTPSKAERTITVKRPKPVVRAPRKLAADDFFTIIRRIPPPGPIQYREPK